MRYCHGLDRKGPPPLFCRSRPTPDPCTGFTVIEMLVVLVMLLLMTTLMLRPIGSGADPAEVKRAAFRLVQEAERAQSRARAERTPWYLVVAGPGAQWVRRRNREEDDDQAYQEIGYQAYQFFPEVAPHPAEEDWIRLPDGIVFSPEPEPSETNTEPEPDAESLIELSPVLEYNLDEDMERVQGPLRVLAVFMPDGSIRVGAGQEFLSSYLRLARGSWLSGATNQASFYGESEGDQAIRIQIRPRTGVLVVEELSSEDPP